jgi:L-iditol 2-dehydrogenase
MHFYGAAPIDGAMQRFVCVAADHAFALPESVSDTAAAMLEPLSVALWAAQRAQLDAAGSVLVIGAGPVGLLVADVAQLSAPNCLVVVDTNQHRLKVAAERTGAETFTPSEWQQQPQQSVDVVMECSGAQAAMEIAAAAVGRTGRIVIVGVGPQHLNVPMSLIQEGEVSVTGSHRYRHTWPRAVELAASGAIKLDSLVTSRFDLESIVEALENSARDPLAIKTVVDVGRSTA